MDFDASALQAARVHLRDGQTAAAKALLDRCPDDDAEVLALRGVVVMLEGATERAQELFRRSLAIRPNYDAALNLAVMAAARGELNEARAYLSIALGADCDGPAALELHRRLAPIDRAPARPPMSPRRALAIWFCQPRSIPWDGGTPREAPLGGTESAAIYLTEALACLGHDVRIYNNCPVPRAVNGVEYRRWETCKADALLDPPDVLVAVRDWHVIANNRFAPLQLFWTGDASDQPFAKGLDSPADRTAIDFLMLQSEWQESTYRSRFGLAPWRCLRTRLGFGPDFGHQAVTSGVPRARRLVYASTPFRGLDLLLAWFPAIRKACPDAELRVCSSMRIYGISQQEDRARFGPLYDLTCQPGVTLLGSVAQPQLAKEMAQARVLAYPNHWPETFCIAAIEAQAAGCPVITSSLGALPETVGDGGVCIPGDPRSDPAFRDRFIAEVVSLLTDDARWEAASRAAAYRARERYSWDLIAREWEGACRDAVEGEDPMIERIAHHARAGRFELVGKLMAREPKPPAIADQAWEALAHLFAYRQGAGPVPSEGDWSRVVHLLGPIRRIPGFDAWAPPDQAASRQ